GRPPLSEGPDREPWRDRASRAARVPGPRDPGRGRLQRGRPRLARRPPGRPGRLHRTGGSRPVLQQHPGGDQRRARHRLRRAPPRLRVPRREPRPGGDLRPGWRRLRRSAAGDHREDGQQGPRPADDAGRGGAVAAGHRRTGPEPRRGAGGSPPDRLPRDHQGRRRRWRPRDARRHGRRGADAAGAGRPGRGRGGLRQRRGLPGALPRAAPPRRGPGARRPPRPRRRARRAGLLAPAPPPEGDRGSAGAEPAAQGARDAAPRRGQGRQGGPVHRRRHARVPAGPGRALLLHGDERPDPGRAPSHRSRDRGRPRRLAVADRGRAAADARQPRDGAGRSRDRGPDHRRGRIRRLPAQRRHRRHLRRTRRSGGSSRLPPLRRLHRAAVLRRPPRQGDHLGARPDRGARPDGAGARRDGRDGDHPHGAAPAPVDRRRGVPPGGGPHRLHPRLPRPAGRGRPPRVGRRPADPGSGRTRRGRPV
ncbi:MAG: Biotin carboxylase of acetyl-CoA carboxylase, partial [uncultured Thermomicrobiales bacterium]